MKTDAAVLVELNAPLRMASLDIPKLKAGQVLVELSFSGVCHTQLLEARGRRGPDAYLPHCLGHEGSGCVLDVGPGVEKVSAGDAVILSWIKGAGADVPGTIYDWSGRSVNAGGVTTFMRHAVVSENRVTRLPDGFPLDLAALIGCAVPTGFGVVFHTADARPGHSLAVFGTGGIGLCAVAAARIAGCTPIIAIDLHADKLAVARRLGATDVIDANTENLLGEIRRICPDGLDVAIEASGRPAVMASALAAVRPRGGVAAIVGNAHAGETLSLDPAQLNQGKRMVGSWGGDSDPDRDYPRYCRLLAERRADLAPLLDRRFGLEQVNEALDALETGHALRPLLDMTHG